jgi:hypothetical protein
MGQTDSTLRTVKLIALLILDIITYSFVFSIWALVNLRVFPWALAAITLSLVFLHIVVLQFGQYEKRYGDAAVKSAAAVTILFYLFVMVFTGITYITISPKAYIVSILIATLVYISTIAGLYLSGTKKAADVEAQQVERSKSLDITLQMMELERGLKGTSGLVEDTAHQAMLEAFSSLNERLKASTPFGRSAKPAVLNMEDQIKDKLSRISEDAGLLTEAEEREKTTKTIVNSLKETKDLIMQREKLMLH